MTTPKLTDYQDLKLPSKEDSAEFLGFPRDFDISDQSYSEGEALGEQLRKLFDTSTTLADKRDFLLHLLGFIVAQSDSNETEQGFQGLEQFIVGPILDAISQCDSNQSTLLDLATEYTEIRDNLTSSESKAKLLFTFIKILDSHLEVLQKTGEEVTEVIEDRNQTPLERWISRVRGKIFRL